MNSKTGHNDDALYNIIIHSQHPSQKHQMSDVIIWSVCKVIKSLFQEHWSIEIKL